MDFFVRYVVLIVILLRFLHTLNACFPMLLTLAGMTIFVNFLLLANALAAMDVTWYFTPFTVIVDGTVAFFAFLFALLYSTVLLPFTLYTALDFLSVTLAGCVGCCGCGVVFPVLGLSFPESCFPVDGITFCATNTVLHAEQCSPSVLPGVVSVGATAGSTTTVSFPFNFPLFFLIFIVIVFYCKIRYFSYLNSGFLWQ